MKKQIKIIAGIVLFLFPILTKAQEYKVSEKSKITINGTSSLHDWESEVKDVSGKGSFTTNKSEVQEIKDLRVVFVVKSIESGKSRMNNLTYEALKEEDHPNITFRIAEVNFIANNTINAIGRLTLAGHAETINVRGLAKVDGNNITITGEYTLNMTDYGIEPPRAMFGTIKVDETVTIKYDLLLVK